MTCYVHVIGMELLIITNNKIVIDSIKWSLKKDAH